MSVRLVFPVVLFNGLTDLREELCGGIVGHLYSAVSGESDMDTT